MFKNILGLIVLSGLFFSGCKKCDCADPLVTGTQTVIISPGAEGKDAYVNSAFPNATSVSDGRFFVMAGTWSGVPGVVRAYIQFDYSSIPADATITSAKLTLFADTSDVGIASFPNGHSNFSGDNNWYINRVTSNWQENTICWNNVPTSDGVGQINVDGTSDNTKAYTVDVTSFVKNEFENPGVYYGMTLRLDTESYYRGVMFCSSDHIYSQLHPRLELTYKVE